MDGGQLTLCLKVGDLHASRRFYETLGMEAMEENEMMVVLKNGNSRLALMTFLDRNCLNFRGAKAFPMRDAYLAAGFDSLTGEPEQYDAEQYDASADGTCWSTFDPDGNNVFFDTNTEELSEAGRQRRIANLLNDTAQELRNLGASDACQQALKTEVIDKHT